MREHELTRRMLRVLEQISGRVSLGCRFPADDVAITLTYFREFLEQVHHAKESDHLYPAAMMSGTEDCAESIGSLMASHDDSKMLLHSLTLFWEPGDLLDEERTGFCDLATTYCSRLRQHIEMEEERLFPFADQLEVDEQARLTKEFQSIGAGHRPMSFWQGEAARLETAYVD